MHVTRWGRSRLSGSRVFLICRPTAWPVPGSAAAERGAHDHRGHVLTADGHPVIVTDAADAAELAIRSLAELRSVDRFVFWDARDLSTSARL